MTTDVNTLTFLNARLPEEIEQGSEGGPNFLTTVLPLQGGGEKRNKEWQYPKVSWNISYGISSDTYLKSVRDFYMATGGRFLGFLFKDWSDYIVGDEDTGNEQTIGTGTGAQTAFPIWKYYDVTAIDGVTTYRAKRPVTRPVQGTLNVYVAGLLKTETTDYTVNYDTGVITFLAAPANGADVGVYCEFNIPVRFDADKFVTNLIWKGAGSIPPIMVMELRERTS